MKSRPAPIIIAGQEGQAEINVPEASTGDVGLFAAQ